MTRIRKLDCVELDLIIEASKCNYRIVTNYTSNSIDRNFTWGLNALLEDHEAHEKEKKKF